MFARWVNAFTTSVFATSSHRGAFGSETSSGQLVLQLVCDAIATTSKRTTAHAVVTNTTLTFWGSVCSVYLRSWRGHREPSGKATLACFCTICNYQVCPETKLSRIISLTFIW